VAITTEISSSSFSPEWFFEGDLYIIYIFAIPLGVENHIGEPQDHYVLDHLLPQVVIDSINLVRC